eukprot:scaffold235767_cov33-Prasinocladus_malaysianus.AAC.1
MKQCFELNATLRAVLRAGRAVWPNADLVNELQRDATAAMHGQEHRPLASDGADNLHQSFLARPHGLFVRLAFFFLPGRGRLFACMIVGLLESLIDVYLAENPFVSFQLETLVGWGRREIRRVALQTHTGTGRGRAVWMGAAKHVTSHHPT